MTRKISASAPSPDVVSGFAPAARTVGLLTLLSRLAGMARDAVCARVFGAGPVWSAFALAFLVPNLFRRLLGEGALSAAFVPEYTKAQQQDPELARRFLCATLVWMLAVVGVVTAVLMVFAVVLLTATPLGESGGLALRLSMVMLPFAPLICGTAFLGGALQVHGRFAPTAAAPIIMNVFLITAAATAGLSFQLPLETTAFLTAGAVTVAGIVQVAVSVLALRPYACWTPLRGGVAEPKRRMLQNVAPAMLGLGALQLNTFLDGLIAGWPVLVGASFTLPLAGEIAYPLDESANAVLFYAQRLYQFPLGVFGIAIATAAFPQLAKAASDPACFAQTLRRALQLSVFIGAPATVGLLLVREDLTAAIFRGGRFGATDTSRVACSLLGYAPAVWAYCCAQTMTRAFYAQGDTRTPMRLAFAFTALNLALNLTLIWPLREAGLAWATAASATAQCIVMAKLLDARLIASGSRLLPASTWRSFGWSTFASVLMGLALWGADTALTGGLHPIPALLAAVFVGLGVYLCAAVLSRREELRWLTERSTARPSGSIRPV